MTHEVDTAAARRLLEGIVSDDVLAGYERLLIADGCAENAAAEVIGGEELVTELCRVGMAQTCPDPATHGRRLVPVSPDHALEGALLGMQSDLRRQHEKVLDGYRRLKTRPGTPSAGRDFANDYIEVITDREEITRTSASLMNTVHTDWMSLETGSLESIGYEIGAEPPLPVFAGEVRSRAIYQKTFMDTPEARRLVQECMDAGEEARLLPTIRMKMKLADERAALLPLTTTGMGGAVLIKSHVIVSAIREYFEMQWERAVPVGGNKTYTDTPLSEVDFEILHLMANGKLDGEIAKKLKMAVSTVRRHIDSIKNELGARNRCAMGAAAHRRGWIE